MTYHYRVRLTCPRCDFRGEQGGRVELPTRPGHRTDEQMMILSLLCEACQERIDFIVRRTSLPTGEPYLHPVGPVTPHRAAPSSGEVGAPSRPTPENLFGTPGDPPLETLEQALQEFQRQINEAHSGLAAEHYLRTHHIVVHPQNSGLWQPSTLPPGGFTLNPYPDDLNAWYLRSPDAANTTYTGTTTTTNTSGFPFLPEDYTYRIEAATPEVAAEEAKDLEMQEFLRPRPLPEVRLIQLEE